MFMIFAVPHGETGANMVTLTEKAAAEVKRTMTQALQTEEAYLRVGVAGGGCSGLDYKFHFDQSATPEKDHITEQYGVKVAVDKKSALYLDGTTIDYVDTLERRGFKFDNPTATKSCGCGKSFSV
ncbi:MAG: iron-sulfur cluster assembly accessory protein [Planctomycetaceae bacterium]